MGEKEMWHGREYDRDEIDAISKDFIGFIVRRTEKMEYHEALRFALHAGDLHPATRMFVDDEVKQVAEVFTKRYNKDTKTIVRDMWGEFKAEVDILFGR